MNAPKEILKSPTAYSKISRMDGEIVEEPFKKYLSRHQAVQSCREMCGYCHLNASVVIQFLREDFGGVSSVRYKEGVEKIAVGFNFGYLQLFKKRGRDPPLMLLRGWEGHYSISCVRWHPREVHGLYASSTQGVIYRFDLSDQTKPQHETAIREDNNEINSFDFDDSGGKFVTGGKDACLRVYDSATNKLITEYRRVHRSVTPSECSTVTNTSGISIDMHEKRIYCVKFQPDNPHVFLSGGWDGVVSVWDVRMPMANVRRIVGPYIFGETIDISGGRVVTGSCVANNSLELWDLGSGDLIQDIQPTNKRVSLYGEYPYAVQFYKGNPAGDQVLAGGAGLAGLQLISIKDAMILYLFEDDKPVVAVDSADGMIAFGGKSNNLMLGKLSFSEATVETPSVASNCTSYHTVRTACSSDSIKS